MTEKSAAARVLLISREAYRAAEKREVPAAVFDSLSAALSHAGSESSPLKRLIPQLKRELKAADSELSKKTSRYLSLMYHAEDFDFQRAVKFLDVMIFGNDMLCRKLIEREREKACAMAQAMSGMAGFLLGEYEGISHERLYELLFGYYPKRFGEPFMDEMKQVFCDGE